MYLVELATNCCFEIILNSSLPKTKISRLVKEINDICLIIHKIRDENSVRSWILLQKENNNNLPVKFSVHVNYKDFYWALRFLRTKPLKNFELIKSCKSALASTNSTLKLLDEAAKAGAVYNYQSIKRKYFTRKQTQEQKINTKLCKYDTIACTIYYFYLTIIECCLRSNLEKENHSEILGELSLAKLAEYISDDGSSMCT